ncbi:MAG: hypothetical protein ABJ308_03515 [Halieaceae bacterium]
MARLIVCAMVLGLAACGGAKDEKPTGVIPQHQLDAMKKAENVEDVLQQAEDKRREAMDNQ